MKIHLITTLCLALASSLPAQEASAPAEKGSAQDAHSAPKKGKKKHKPIRPAEREAPFSLSSAKVATPPQGSFATDPAFEENFNPGWNESHPDWMVARWKQNRTMMGIDRCVVNEDGLLEQTVLPELPGKGGSMQTKREFGYGRWVVRAKPSAIPGVLNSIFTKDWDDLTTDQRDDGNKGEVDIEFLTSTFKADSGKVHLAIHLDGYNPYWEEDVPIDFNPSDEFYEWGFDILPDRVIWHVNGKKLGEWLYDGEYKITPDYEFYLNSWTMKPWIQGPPPEKAVYQVDWVKFYPYQP
ncbi:MAG: glycoside hydrolase family 16 protein [Chthoniobacterales bacterium]